MLSSQKIRDPLRQLLASRCSPEARALYLKLARFVDLRVQRIVRDRYSDLLSAADREDVVGDVLYLLMSGTLAQFRGQSLPELLGFVRTVTDRNLWRAAQKKIRDRNALTGELAEEIRGWSSAPLRPDQALFSLPQPPISEQDATYLVDLFQVGSQSALARQQGVSRAAVTQRIQRIRRRIQRLSAQDQDTTETWLRSTAVRISSEPCS